VAAPEKYAHKSVFKPFKTIFTDRPAVFSVEQYFEIIIFGIIV
jgi:hypothetical protein